MSKLAPDRWVDSVYKIDFEDLKKRSIKGLIFDIDNTLAPYDMKEPDEALALWIDNLKKSGFVIGILSNARSGRAKVFAEKLNLLFKGNAAKPMKRGYKQLCEMMALNKDEVAMVGDQIYTDIWGGNRFGCYTVLVTPIELRGEPVFVRSKRLLERPILRKIKKTNGKE